MLNVDTMAKKAPTVKRKSSPAPVATEGIVMGLRWDPTTYQRLEEYRASHGLRSMQAVVREAVKALLDPK